MARWLTAPSHCFIIFNVVLAGWHLPPMYEYAMAHHPIHIVQHLCFMTAAVLMWWPVLSPLPELKVCVAYEGDDGARYEHVPYHQSVLHKVRPVYETVPGWGVEIDGAARIEDLPDAARDYVRLVEELAGVPVSFVSVGPGREQTVVLPRAA